MLTPQEVSEHTFQKASFGGYNMGQVDEFLDILTGDYTALYSENAVLKNKMKVLVDKVEEYRSTEEAMRKALLAAQKMADDMVKEAESKKDQILVQAERESQERSAAIQHDIEVEEYRLKQAQQHTAAFVEKVRALYIQEAEYLSKLEELCLPEAAPHVETVDEKASEIDDNVQRLLAKAMQAATAENLLTQAAEQDEEEDMSDTAEFTPGAPPEDSYDRDRARAYEEGGRDDSRPDGRIDFGSLQFGRDYEIT